MEFENHELLNPALDSTQTFVYTIMCLKNRVVDAYLLTTADQMIRIGISLELLAEMI